MTEMNQSSTPPHLILNNAKKWTILQYRYYSSKYDMQLCVNVTVCPILPCSVAPASQLVEHGTYNAEAVCSIVKKSKCTDCFTYSVNRLAGSSECIDPETGQSARCSQSQIQHADSGSALEFCSLIPFV